MLTPLFMLRKVLLFAVFFSIIGSYCWHYGLHMVPVNNVIIINYTIPMVIPILVAVFLKEKLPKTLIVSIIICFVSIILINKPKEILKLGYLLLLVAYIAIQYQLLFQKIDDKTTITDFCFFYFKVLVVIITSIHAIPSLSVKIINDTQILFPALLVGMLYLFENILFFTAHMLSQFQNCNHSITQE